MGGVSIPLPALGVNPPAPQQNSLDQYARLLQLKNQMAEQPLRNQALQQQVQEGGVDLQQKQQQLTDQKALTSAMQSWDGKDYNDLIPLIVKNGGSAQAVMGLKSKLLEQQTALSTAFKNNADGAKAQVDAAKEKGDLLDGALSPLVDPKQVSDADLPNALTTTAQSLTQRGLLDPQHAQAVQALVQTAQQNPAQVRQQLDIMRKSGLAQSQILDEAAKKAAVDKDTAQAGQATAAAAKDNAEMAAGGTTAMADSRYRNILMNKQLDRPVSAEDDAFVDSYKKQKTLVPTATFNLQNSGLSGGSGGQPSALVSAVASGQMKWSDVISPRTPMSVKQQFASEVRALNPSFNSGDFDVEKQQREAFTSGAYSQQLTAINTAREHMKTFQDLAANLGNGNVQILNKLGNTFGVQFGSDNVGNFNIAKQAFSSEVGKAFAGASVAEGDRKDIGDQISAASSPKQLAGIARTADALLAGKQTSLKNTYQSGQSGHPNFGDSTPAPQGSNAGIRAPGGVSVGSTITQGGHKYKVTAVDKDGKPTSADPL